MYLLGKLHAVQQALATKQHLTDSEVAGFVTALLDEVENLKVSEEALVSEQGQAILNDDDVAQAYVENFAMKVFAKADKDVYSKTTTKGTATTFIAAATFLDVLKTFQSPLEKDISDKIRYAKYQAARIIKAFKAGEDPNLYDPPEPTKEEEEQVDGLLDESKEPELDLPAAASHDPGSPGLQLPSAASHDPGNDDSLGLPAAASHDPSQSLPFDLPAAASHPPDTVSRPAEVPKPAPAPAHVPAPAPAPAPAPLPKAAPQHPHHLSKQDVQSMMDETEVIASAQKHAKFAISALNYEDMGTAIRELTAALDLLKAHES